jgi:DNA topoisomerase-6 subunit B
MVLLVHIASVWVPFTSESKEAIAHYPEILAEIKLAAMECGRKLATYLRKKKRAQYESNRRNLFELYIEETSTALSHLTGGSKDGIKAVFTELAYRVTSDADFEKELEKAARAEPEKKKKKKSKDEDE